jgi:hypothetical protein
VAKNARAWVRGSAALKVWTQARLRCAYWARERRFAATAGLVALGDSHFLRTETSRNRKIAGKAALGVAFV